MTGAMLTDTGTFAFTSSRSTCSRRTGDAARGSSFFASSSSSVTSVTVTRPALIAPSFCHRSTSRSTSAPFVIVDTGCPQSAITSRHCRAMPSLCSSGW